MVYLYYVICLSNGVDLVLVKIYLSSLLATAGGDSVVVYGSLLAVSLII